MVGKTEAAEVILCAKESFCFGVAQILKGVVIWGTIKKSLP